MFRYIENWIAILVILVVIVLIAPECGFDVIP